MRWIVLLAALFISTAVAQPRTFEEAKVQAKQYVYLDQNHSSTGDIYCGCSWEWTGKSGGRMNLNSCGYQARTNADRAARMEWEHIVPASNFGRQRQCWQNGGRENCNRTDPVFNAMEADVHNLYPSVGEVNGDRSNLNYGMAVGVAPQYGMCRTKIDFPNRTAEPRAEMKGLAARVTFYMYDRYNLRMSSQQEQVLMAWDRAFPVTAWEIERDQRNARVMGHNNPFVTKQKTWTRGYVPNNQTVPQQVIPNREYHPSTQPVRPPVAQPQSQPAAAPVVGNRNSQIYHVYGKCPNYSDVSANSRVAFQNEAQALAAGFRKAKNCR